MHLFIQYLRTGIIRIYSMNSEIMSLLGISKESLEEARLVVNKSPLVLRTPLLKNVGENFGLDDLNICQVHFKLESMQKTGEAQGVCGLGCCGQGVLPRVGCVWCDGVSRSRGSQYLNKQHCQKSTRLKWVCGR